MMNMEIGGEGLGLVNRSSQRQHGRRRQGWKSCWKSVGIGDSGGRKQQGRPGAEAADSSEGIGVWDGLVRLASGTAAESLCL